MVAYPWKPLRSVACCSTAHHDRRPTGRGEPRYTDKHATPHPTGRFHAASRCGFDWYGRVAGLESHAPGSRRQSRPLPSCCETLDAEAVYCRHHHRFRGEEAGWCAAASCQPQQPLRRRCFAATRMCGACWRRMVVQLAHAVACRCRWYYVWVARKPRWERCTWNTREQGLHAGTCTRRKPTTHDEAVRLQAAAGRHLCLYRWSLSPRTVHHVSDAPSSGDPCAHAV